MSSELLVVVYGIKVNDDQYSDVQLHDEIKTIIPSITVCHQAQL
ncbi:hypothetical protein [Cysteiniphilum halobium]